jgi:Copper amine oxidase N-terminal domain.
MEKKMRRLIQVLSITILPILFALIFFTIVGFIQPDIKIKYNGETIFLDDSKPLYYDDTRISTILVPIDIIAKKIGDKLAFDFDAETLIIKSDKYTVKFTDNSKDVYVNNVLKTSPTNISFKDGHVYAPLRIFCDSLGRNVYWDSTACTINIFDSHSSDIFNYVYASDFVSNENFKMQTNKLFFYNNSSNLKLKPDYLPAQKINPNINKQIYGIANVIVDPAYYTDINYISAGELKDDSNPYVSISVGTKDDDSNQKNYFNFSFYDQKAVNLQEDFNRKDVSTKSVIKLEINNLTLSGTSSRTQTRDILKERLKLSLIGMFGESTGLNISEFLGSEYIKLIDYKGSNYLNYVKNRRFDNVNVNLFYNYDGLPANSMQVYFSIK